jgi:hypothetical protein
VIPISLRGLLPLPQGSPEPATGRLPWPEGSILSGSLESTPEPQQAVLLIGGHRFLAHVPPDMPQRGLWLQVIDQGPPARFRLLSAQQAETEITHMLEKLVGKPETGKAMPTPHADPAPPLKQADIPYDFVPISPAPPRWLIVDHQDEGAPRGMLRGEASSQGFQLRGRLDLTHLGPVSFILASAQSGMRLSLRAAQADGYRALQCDFPDWLVKHQDGLDASLQAGAIEDEDSIGARTV